MDDAGTGICLGDGPPLVWAGPVPIASRAYSDLVLASNPAMPLSYFRQPTEHVHSAGEMREIFRNAAGWTWLRIGSGARNDVAVFATEVLPRLDRPIRLVTTDGDNAIPGHLPDAVVGGILSSPLVEAWYTQNYDRTVIDPKLRAIPIGLDLHTGLTPNAKLALLEAEGRRAPAFAHRPAGILHDGTCRSHPERDELARIVAPLAHVKTMDRRLGFAGAMQRYARHPFVLSPRGNGLDCHRTWEVLLLPWTHK